MDLETGGIIATILVGMVALAIFVSKWLKATPEEREALQDQALAVAIQAAVTRAEALLKGEPGARRKAWVIAQIQSEFPFIDSALIDAAIEKAVDLLNKQQAIATAGHRSFVPARRWEITHDTSYDNDRASYDQP